MNKLLLLEKQFKVNNLGARYLRPEFGKFTAKKQRKHSSSSLFGGFNINGIITNYTSVLACDSVVIVDVVVVVVEL